MQKSTVARTPHSGRTPFLTGVKKLRERARQNLSEGAVTANYEGDVAKAIDILQSVLATDEREHMGAVAGRINQLGGTPDFDPRGLESRAASEYGSADNLVAMIKRQGDASGAAVPSIAQLDRTTLN